MGKQGIKIRIREKEAMVLEVILKPPPSKKPGFPLARE
jgi:hypothetical protein